MAGSNDQENPRDGLSLARLEALLAAYGAAAERWPEAERGAARALIDASPEARALVADAAGLDRALDALAAPAPSAALQRRLSREMRVHGGRQSFGRAWRWAMASLTPRPVWRVAAVAGVFLVGVAVGVGVAPNVRDANVADAGLPEAPIAVALVGGGGDEVVVTTPAPDLYAGQDLGFDEFVSIALH